MTKENHPTYQETNVVLLHGIGRSPLIMKPMEAHLRHRGFQVFNVGYPSLRCKIEVCAQHVYEQIKPLFHKPTPLHFVCHSMGGLVLRSLLMQYRPSHLGRVVLLGTPNHGTAIVNWMRKTGIFQLLYGPASLQMGTDAKAVWRTFPPIDYDVGVIAGSRSVDPLFWALLEKPNDGKVTLHSAKVDGMKAFILLPVAHPFLPSNKYAKHQTALFLESGEFCDTHPECG